LPLYAKKG